MGSAWTCDTAGGSGVGPAVMRYCLMYGFAAIRRATIATASAGTGARLPRLRRPRVHAAELLRAAHPPGEMLAGVARRRDPHGDRRALRHLAVREQRELRLGGRLLDALAGALRAGERDPRALRDAHDLERRHPAVAPAEHRVPVDGRRRIERDLDLHRPARRALLLERAADLDRVPLARRDDARGGLREAGAVVEAAAGQVGSGVGRRVLEGDHAEYLVEARRGRGDVGHAVAARVEGGPDRLAVLRLPAGGGLGGPGGALHGVAAGVELRVVEVALGRVARRVRAERQLVAGHEALPVVEEDRLQVGVSLGWRDLVVGGGGRGRERRRDDGEKSELPNSRAAG